MPTWWDLAYLTHAPWDTGEPPDELTELVENGAIRPCRVLDIGCGTGTSVVYLASKGFEAVGLDISRVAIKKAEKRAFKAKVKCKFYVADFLDRGKLEVKLPEPFDAVLDIGCLHSLRRADRMRYLASMRYVTHSGSTYLLWAFLPADTSSQLYGPPGINKKEVMGLFSEGFQVLGQRRVNSSERVMVFYEMRRTSV